MLLAFICLIRVFFIGCTTASSFLLMLSIVSKLKRSQRKTKAVTTEDDTLKNATKNIKSHTRNSTTHIDSKICKNNSKAKSSKISVQNAKVNPNTSAKKSTNIPAKEIISQQTKKVASTAGHTNSCNEDSEDESEDESEEVEAVIGKICFRNEVKYLLKWKGFSDDFNSWEPEKNLNCWDLIAKYEANKAKKTAQIKASTQNIFNRKKRKNSLVEGSPSHSAAEKQIKIENSDNKKQTESSYICIEQAKQDSTVVAESATLFKSQIGHTKAVQSQLNKAVEKVAMELNYGDLDLHEDVETASEITNSSVKSIPSTITSETMKVAPVNNTENIKKLSKDATDTSESVMTELSNITLVSSKKISPNLFTELSNKINSETRIDPKVNMCQENEDINGSYKNANAEIEKNDIGIKILDVFSLASSSSLVQDVDNPENSKQGLKKTGNNTMDLTIRNGNGVDKVVKIILSDKDQRNSKPVMIPVSETQEKLQVTEVLGNVLNNSPVPTKRQPILSARFKEYALSLHKTIVSKEVQSTTVQNSNKSKFTITTTKITNSTPVLSINKPLKNNYIPVITKDESNKPIENKISGNKVKMSEKFLKLKRTLELNPLISISDAIKKSKLDEITNKNIQEGLIKTGNSENTFVNASVTNNPISLQTPRINYISNIDTTTQNTDISNKISDKNKTVKSTIMIENESCKTTDAVLNENSSPVKNDDIEIECIKIIEKSNDQTTVKAILKETTVQVNPTDVENYTESLFLSDESSSDFISSHDEDDDVPLSQRLACNKAKNISYKNSTELNQLAYQLERPKKETHVWQFGSQNGTPDQIVASAEVEGQCMLLMQWKRTKGKNKTRTLVPEWEAIKNCPNLVCEFYENKAKWPTCS